MASPDVYAGTPVDEKTLQDLSPHYTPEQSRLQSLDILKGLAVLAGLFFSIYTWGGISKGMQGEVLLRHKGFTYYLQIIVTALVEDKMRSLIALVFGAGMLLLLTRPHAGSRFKNQELLIRRNFFLLLFGILNGVLLLWPNDILYGLGITGVIFFAFTRLGAKALFILALAATVIGSGKIYWHYADDKKAYSKFLPVEAKEKKIKADSAKLKDSLKTGFRKTDTLTWKEKEDKGAWEGISKKYTWEKKNDSGQIKALQDGRYAKIYDQQLGATQQKESFWFYRFGFWQFAALVLLGMALFKTGFFNGRFSSSRYLLIFLLCMASGLLLYWFRIRELEHSIKDYTLFVKSKPLPYEVFRPAEMLLIALSYASLVVFFVKKEWFGPIMHILSLVGKMALTNYLMQSIIMGIVFYGCGMGYYGRIPQNWLYFIVVEVIIVQVVFSVFWLRAFHSGPAEWLISSLSKGKRQPFLKNAGETALGSQDLKTI